LDILSFFDEDDDRELDKHTKFLEFMALVRDVRPVEEWRRKFESGASFEYEDVLGHLKTFHLSEFLAQREQRTAEILGRKSREAKHNANSNPSYYPLDPYESSSAGLRNSLTNSSKGYDTAPSTATTPLLSSVIHSVMRRNSYWFLVYSRLYY
jgi:hypothetical protein